METPEDPEGWRAEAEAVIKDVQDHVESVEISSSLPNSNKKIYLNLKTLEGIEFCVELSGFGFKIVGHARDTSDKEDGKVFETPYSLLETISLRFRDSFGGQLIQKLSRLTEDNQ